ncbi:MAG: phosphomannomutase/phosphoglucomutase [candidate division Zixibacteria bacterium]|nr:phosphomannomutase/phosphoglucomutase [candidate division Zixibacteria bacterium]
MEFDESIFKAYDIRGVYPGQVNPDVYKAIGTAVGNVLGAKTGVVGRDMRNSSQELAAAFVEGLRDAGVDVTDIGLVSTDSLYFAVGKMDFDCGAIITASHNPSQYNGLKICKKGAEPLSSQGELADVMNLLVKDEFKSATKKGSLSEQDIISSFIDHVLTFVDTQAIKPFKIVIDAGNGMAGLIVPKLFEKLPCQLVPMFFELDGSFPNHPASPLEPENIADLRRRVLQEKADFGAAFDGDADRMFLVDENANPLGGDMVTALVARSMLEKNPGAKIIYNLICSKAVPRVITESGGNPIRTRVGHAFIKALMKGNDAVFGGEHSGHFYFRDNWFADSGLIAFVICLELLSAKESKLSQLVASIDTFYRSGEINSRVEDIPAKLDELIGAFPRAVIDKLDGVTIDNGDFWFNVRPSNTEPLLRLNLEADSTELMQEASENVLKIIRG